MVTLEIKTEEIKRAVGKDFDIEELLFNFGYEVEFENEIAKIEITPERIDLLSKRILIENIKSWLGLRGGLIDFNSNPSNYEIIVKKPVKKIRPFILASVVKNCKIDNLESLINLQEKLHKRYGIERRKVSIGLYNADMINFPLFYDAWEPEKISFVPLGFDKKMNAIEILKEHPKGIEYGKLIKNFERFPIFYDSVGNILSMPPIINSNDIGRIDENTENVLVEVTGTDLKTMKEILKIMSIELNGEIYSVKIDYGKKIIEEPKFNQKEFFISKQYVEKNLGIRISEEEIIRNLKKMGFDAFNENKKIKVIVPSIRFDVIHEFDILDEIARAYNYNNFKIEIPKLTQTIGNLSKKTEVEEKIREKMIGLGFTETTTFCITNEEDQFKKMRIEAKNYVKIKNPISNQFTIMRVWILPELLKNIRSNIQLKQPIKIFEIGEVINLNENNWNKVEEDIHLAFAIVGEKFTYTNGRQVVEALIEKCEFKELKHNSFIEGRVAEILFNNYSIGIVGELHPEVLINFDIYYPIVAGEIKISKVFL